MPFGVRSTGLGRVGPPRRATALGVGLGVWTIVVLAVPGPSTAKTWLLSISRYLTAELFLVAAVLLLATWRSTRSALTLRAAVGLVAMALALPALAILTPWAPDGIHINPAAPLARLVLFLPVLGVLAGISAGGRTTGPSGTAPRSQSRPTHPVKVFAALVVPLIALAAIGDAGHLAAPSRVITALAGLGEIALSLGWAALALRARGRGASTSSAPRPQMSVAMFLMAAGELVRAVTITTTGTSLGIAPGFALLAAAAFVLDAGSQLRRVQRAETDETRELSSALTRTRQLLERLEQGQRERLHDVRSAVVGVIGASRLLTGAATTVDDDREAMQRMIAAELTRLQTVLDVDSAEPVTDFDLAAVLGPVLLAHRIGAGGSGLTAEIGRARCTGRAAATATVLDNLLDNARTHAPGAQVWVRTSEEADRVTVVVEDDGPGIPAAERPLVLRPGVRGSTAVAPGTGLGLANCARTVGEQGGTLRLSSRPGGGTRVTFTLPTAPSATRRTRHALAS